MNLDLDEINSEWAKDAIIDDLDLVSSIREIPKLHAKWVQTLSHAKRRWHYLQSKYNVQRQLRFRYYRGELTKAELDEHGWTQWQGIKPFKGEMDEFLKGDDSLNKQQEKISAIEIIIQTLEQIVRSINSRGYDLRALLEAKKFYHGSN